MISFSQANQIASDFPIPFYMCLVYLLIDDFIFSLSQSDHIKGQKKPSCIG